jgi:predicted HNH restriction endonuclease
MNPGSALINLSVFKNLMTGKKFTRTLTAETFDYFLENILNDFGSERLSICVNALSLHINYIESKRKYKMGLVGDIHKKYLALLSNVLSAENDEDQNFFPEGAEKYKLHISKERNRKLVELAKEKYRATDPKMKCQVCRFSFADCYGDLGKDYIEAHHVFPISDLTKETLTKIEDLAMVCSNCHRMLHRRRPWLSTRELKMLLPLN